MLRPLEWGIVGACTITIFKDICDNYGRYFFMNSPENIEKLKKQVIEIDKI